MSLFPATLSLSQTLVDLIESEERILDTQCRLADELLRPRTVSSHAANGASCSNEEDIIDEHFEPTKLIVTSDGRKFEYSSLDEILGRVLTEEDMLNMNSSQDDSLMEAAGGGLSDLDNFLAKGADKKLVAGLKKLQDYYCIRENHKTAQRKSCKEFLKGLEQMNQDAYSKLPDNMVDLVSTTMATLRDRQFSHEEIPERFQRKNPSMEHHSEMLDDPLIDQVQQMLRKTVAADLAELSVHTPHLPSILCTANVLNNMERPQRLIFMEND